MANVKISELPSAAALDGTEAAAVVQGGITSQAPIQYISDYIRPYKVYSALISQAGTAAPTVTILENTIGNIVWTRISEGQYQAELANAFTLNKTFLLTQQSFASHENVFYALDYTSDTFLYISSFDFAAAVYIDGLTNLSIEIRVYN